MPLEPRYPHTPCAPARPCVARALLGSASGSSAHARRATSGDTTPCRTTGVTSRSHVHCEEIQVRCTCGRDLCKVTPAILHGEVCPEMPTLTPSPAPCALRQKGTLFARTPLCPYGIAYRRILWIGLYGQQSGGRGREAWCRLQHHAHQLGVQGAHTRRGAEPLLQGSGFRVQGAGFRVQGVGFRVQGSGSRVQVQWTRATRRQAAPAESG